MNLENKILSDVIVHMKYARYLKDKQRRETWEEIVDRNKEMHIKKNPDIAKELEWAYSYVYDKKVLPSMRSLQFAGKAIEVNPSRIYNCSGLSMDHTDSMSETMFLLLGGSGVGFSVIPEYISKLPTILKPLEESRRFLVADSIEGWAEAVKVLIESYTLRKARVAFDFSEIRAKGSELVTAGGKAPGPDPLKECLNSIRKVLNRAAGRRLTALEVHDIECYIADAVMAGGK